MNTPFHDHYRTLEVKPAATAGEIRQAYRRLAKMYHPDMHQPERKDWAKRQFSRINQAYEILGDPGAKADYDVHYHVQSASFRQPARPAMSWMTEGERAAREILTLLLETRSNDAITAFEALEKRSGSECLLALELRDYLDCKFLLGEAYESRGELGTAIELYEEVFAEEIVEPRMRCYFEELTDRLRVLYPARLASAKNARDAFEVYEKALKLDNTNGTAATLHKKMAETLLGLGERNQASECLRRAFKANPRLKNVRRLCEQLHFTPGVPA